MLQKKTILVAPLNWGLGHATRCIPIINALLSENFNVLIASDGNALNLLQKEFPKLETTELPSYNITCPKNGNRLLWKLLINIPLIRNAILKEKVIISKLIALKKIDGIISDNRFGVINKSVPSVYITHQLNIISGKTTFISKKIHQNIIKDFDECWVPDFENEFNLSGSLGHLKQTKLKIVYTGVLSRMKKENLSTKYDILLLISGPETQRSLFEEILIKAFLNTSYNVLLVQGIVETTQHVFQKENITIYNFMTTTELEKAINQSNIIVSRSGYTTIMDLAVLEKKAFFIPTPGQYEQEYLAQRMCKLKMAPFCKQKDFSANKIKEVENYKGLFTEENPTSISELFHLFKRK